MFWNHFEAQGFRRKNGMPIRDLKALFKIWIQEDKKKQEQEKRNPRMSLKEIKELQNDIELQKILKGER